MSLIEIKVKETRFVSEDTRIGEVALMVAESESRVVCLTREHLTVGTISDHDLRSSSANLGREFGRLSAKHIMVRPPVTIDWRPTSSDLIDAAILVRRSKARTAVVMRDGSAIGIISLEQICELDILQTHARGWILSLTSNKVHT